jgi:hypothetical protein
MEHGTDPPVECALCEREFPAHEMRTNQVIMIYVGDAEPALCERCMGFIIGYTMTTKDRPSVSTMVVNYETGEEYE